MSKCIDGAIRESNPLHLVCQIQSTRAEPGRSGSALSRCPVKKCSARQVYTCCWASLGRREKHLLWYCCIPSAMCHVIWAQKAHTSRNQSLIHSPWRQRRCSLRGATPCDVAPWSNEALRTWNYWEVSRRSSFVSRPMFRMLRDQNRVYCQIDIQLTVVMQAMYFEMSLLYPAVEFKHQRWFTPPLI